MIPKRLVTLVLDRDAHRCTLNLPGCLVVATVADHRVNRGMGGSAGVLDDAANLIAACGLCNGLKETVSGTLLARLYDLGIKIKPAATHTASLDRARETPVIYPTGVPSMLTSSGARYEISLFEADRRIDGDWTHVSVHDDRKAG